MLFNSAIFLFAFLPITLLGYYLLGRKQSYHAILWLTLASLVFYAWWDWRNVPIFMASVILNFYFARWIVVAPMSKRRVLLTTAITINLLALAYFKYFLFLLGAIAPLMGMAAPTETSWALPLGISFFTFTQIAFLVDAYRGKAREHHFLHYLLFVSFFPHLIAGPVLHHAQMVPQFLNRHVAIFRKEYLILGLTVFTIGLAKKVLLADSLATYASPVFEVANLGMTPNFIESWTAALAYSLQLYFDFSGYSDMAVGLGLMFNIRLPQNFNSPYRATSIIDFWRRWHITLSEFLRTYLYIPLGGNRLGIPRRYLNIMVTMLLGGLWHGAGWTFVVWGALHGALLSLNHAWRYIATRLSLPQISHTWLIRQASMLLTFALVVIAWVIFRAHDLPTAGRMLEGMTHLSSIVLPTQLAPFAHVGFEIGNATPTINIAIMQAWAMILLGLGIVWCLPNPYQWMRDYQLTCDLAPRKETATSSTKLHWRGRKREAWIIGVLLGLSLLALTRTSEFLYFQF